MKSTVSRWFAAVMASLLLGVAPGAAAWQDAAGQPQQQEGVRTVTLDNGITLALMRRPTLAGHIACGWMLRGGSSLDPPDAAGLCHFVMTVLRDAANTSVAAAPPDAQAGVSFPPLNDMQQRAVMVHDLTFWETQYPRWRGGEIGDPFAPLNQTPELTNIREALAVVFDPTGVPAGTAPPTIFHHGVAHDFALAFAQIPAIKLEDWAAHTAEQLSAWPAEPQFKSVQSDLLTRRIELGARSPALVANHELESALWPDDPYGRRAMSSVATIDDVTYEQAAAFFHEHVRPENVVIFVVGDFNPIGSSFLLRQEFEKMVVNDAAPDDEIDPNMDAEAPTSVSPAAFVAKPPSPRSIARDWSAPTRVREMFRSVPVDHADHAAILMMSRILRHRLHGELVAPNAEPNATDVSGDAPRPGSQAVAAWVAAGADGRARSGMVFIEAEAVTLPPENGLPGRSLLNSQQLQTVIDNAIDRIKREPVGMSELEETRQRLMAELVAPMADQVSLLVTLATYEGLSDWRRFNTLYGALNAVTPVDIQAAARTYLTADRRVIGRFDTRSFDLATNPELTQLAVDQRQAAITLLNRMIDSGTPDSWAQTVETLERDLPNAQPLQQIVIRFLIRRLNQRLESAD